MLRGDWVKTGRRPGATAFMGRVSAVSVHPRNPTRMASIRLRVFLVVPFDFETSNNVNRHLNSCNDPDRCKRAIDPYPSLIPFDAPH